MDSVFMIDPVFDEGCKREGEVRRVEMISCALARKVNIVGQNWKGRRSKSTRAATALPGRHDWTSRLDLSQRI